MSEVDPSIIGKETEPRWFEYDFRDISLYALGVGAGVGPDDLPYVYEGTPGGIRPLPSFCLIPAMRAFPPVGNVDFSRFLHGEQSFTIHKPLATRGKIKVVGKVSDIFDKGKAAVYHIKVSGSFEDGAPAFDAVWVNFYIGAGGFGGDPGPKAKPVTPPEGVAPDYVFEDVVPENMAAIHRLSGDFNPLHLDPEFARGGGFDRPILHGLCTYGYAVRRITTGVLGGDPTRMKGFSARFSSVVFPGDKIMTECWKTDGRLLVQVKTDRGAALSNGVAEISR